MGAVPPTRTPADRPERAAIRCSQAPHAAAGRRCREGLAALDSALAGYRAPAAWRDGLDRRDGRMATGRGRATAPSNAALPSDAQVIGAVHRATPADAIMVCAAGGLPGELHKLWQARRVGDLSPGIRLFLHGLRDRRRAWREAGAAGPRGDRAGRRRQLPDAELGDRHVGDAGTEADDRAAGQRRLRLHRPPAARHRRRGVQQPAGRLRRRPAD